MTTKRGTAQSAHEKLVEAGLEYVARMGAHLTTSFKPCVVVFDDPLCTEIVLRDCAIVWHPVRDVVRNPTGTEVGYDMETGELVAIRVHGDVSKRKF